jgi:hypothetical protein
MSGHLVKDGHPKPAPRRSKGSVVSTTYEFQPDQYMRQADQRTFGQMLYDSKQGKVCGRTPKNWGKEITVFN